MNDGEEQKFSLYIDLFETIKLSISCVIHSWIRKINK